MAKHAVSLTTGNYEALKKTAKRLGKPMTVLLNTILENVELSKQENVEPALLFIPVALTKENKEGLHQWLRHRADMITEHFYSK